MNGIIDIHCHLLPGIDDGPKTMADSIAMARAAVDSGISTIAATPHLRPDFPLVHVDEIADRCAELRRELDAANIPLEVIPAGEVGLLWALEADDHALKTASYGQRGTDILIETPTSGGSQLPRLLADIAGRGYRVVLAHPERLRDFADDPTLGPRLAEQGVLLQVNADSLLAGRSSSRVAEELLRGGTVAIVASDGHRGADWRPVTRLSELAHQPPKLLADEDRLLALTRSTPRAVLDGGPAAAVGGSDARGLRRFWR